MPSTFETTTRSIVAAALLAAMYLAGPNPVRATEPGTRPGPPVAGRPASVSESSPKPAAAFFNPPPDGLRPPPLRTPVRRAPVPRAPAPEAKAILIAELPENPTALWVVRDALTSPGKIRGMVLDAHRAGVTDLLVQVRGRGDAYYISDLIPPAPPLAKAWSRNGRFDPLRQVLELAHERGMRVHAWVNVYLVWSGKGTPPDGHVVRQHPDWVAVDRWGASMATLSPRTLKKERTEGVYLEPGTRGVVRHFVSVVEEILARYPVDGIHLDYVRYPELSVGYSPAMRAGFSRRTGIDPVELKTNRRGLLAERGEQGIMDLEREWQTFKADQITALVKNLRVLTRRVRPDLILSAAVKPDPRAARDRNGQDWVRWVEEGLVDVVAPMMYSTSAKTVRLQAEQVARLLPPERVWVGIAVYNQSLTAAGAKIDAVRRMGLTGISIFSYNSVPNGGSGLVYLNRAR